MKRLSAQSLIELLLVITILAMVGFALFFSYTRSQSNQALKSSTEQLANDLRLAHVYSREGRERSQWGITSTLDKKGYELFYRNSTIQKRQSGKNLETTVEFDQSFEVWFEAGTGYLLSPKTIVLKNKYGRQMHLTVSSTGVIETFYQ